MKSNKICKDTKLCTGCEACANICPRNAIRMRTDWRGFLYPHINQDLCIDCGLCQKRCPTNQPPEAPFNFNCASVFIEKDKVQLLRASSGGAFGVMARHILKEKGVVIGCSMDKEYNVKYVCINKPEELTLLHGSKYVQSTVGMIYRKAKEVLESNHPVLFCGCPCQVAGLKQYLNKEYDRLITMDLICHGVPAQPYFHSYVKDLLQKKKNTGITTFRFRFKHESYDEISCIQNSVYDGFHNKDFYMTYFLWGKGYRPSCYRCRFAGFIREGDFTIGDFWNNRIAKLPIDDHLGASLVLFNTHKARQLEWVFQQNGTCIPIPTLHDAVGGDGGQLKHPSKNDIRTDLIYLLYKIFGVAGPKFLFAFEKLRFRL